MRIEIEQRYKPPFKIRFPKNYEKFIADNMPKFLIYNRYKKKAFCTACEHTIDYCWPGEKLQIERTVHIMPRFGTRQYITCPVCGKQVVTWAHTSSLISDKYYINFWNSNGKLFHSINYAQLAYSKGELPVEAVYTLETTGLGEYSRDNQRVMCESYYSEKFTDIGYVPQDINDLPETWFPNARTAIKNSFLKYNDIEHAPTYIKDMSQYLKIIAKYPQTEYLEKAGLRDIIYDRLYSRPNYIFPNWRAKTLPGFLGIDQNDINKLKQWDMFDDTRNIGMFKQIRKHHKKVTKKMLEYVMKMDYGLTSLWSQQCRKQDPYKLTLYINKQKAAHTSQCHIGAFGPGPCEIYRDYLDQIKELGYNLKDEYNLYPPDLPKAHDRVSKELRDYMDKKTKAENRKKDAIYKKHLKQLKEWAWTDGKYLIRPLECVADFKAEGRNNKNCVAGYFRRCADGQTNVFVIRRCDAPGTSYVTLELSNDKRILQCRKTGNTVPPEDVTRFAQDWLNNVVKKKKKGKKAA